MGQSIFSNAGIAAISRVLVVLLGLASTALTVRIISVEHFGAYSLVLTIGTFAQLFADFGLYLTASRELGAAQGRTSERVGHIVSLRIALLGAMFVASTIAFLFIPGLRALTTLFIVIAVGLIAQSLSQLMMGVFQAYGCIWKATVGDIAGRCIQVAMLGYFFLRQSQQGMLIAVAFAFSFGLCGAFCVHALLVPHRRMVFPRISVSAWKYIAKVSWPIGIMLVLNVIYFRSDILILSFFRSGEEVGWYSLAYKIIENGLFFPAMLGGLLLPHISASLAGNTTRAQRFVSEGLELSLYAAIIVITTLVVFSSPIVMFIAGPDFSASAPLLRILSGALAIMFVGNIFGFTLIALSQQKKLALLYGALVLFNGIANGVFIPRYGAFAAAWATVATEAIAMLVAAHWVRQKVAYSLPVRALVLAACGALVSAYVGYILPPYVHIGIRLAMVGILYVGMCYTFGVWGKKTFAMLRTVSSI